MSKYNDSQSSSPKIKAYASGSLRDLAADSPDGTSCARAIELLADGDVTSILDKDGNEMGPITGWSKGIKLVECSKVNAAVAFVAYF